MPRLVSAALAVALLTLPVSARATTDTSTCRVDPAETGSAPATDIVCFALNVDCTDAIGALRVRSTDTSTFPTTRLGVTWSLSFKVDGVRHEFVLARSVTGPDSATMHVDGAADQTPATSVSATTITWSVPRSATAALKRGGTITEVTAKALATVGGGSDVTAMDNADNPRRTPSCDPSPPTKKSKHSGAAGS